MLARIRKFYTNDSFEFTGFNRKASICKMDIWRSEDYDTGELIRYIVLVTDVYNNKGTSVLNMSEYLATVIFDWLELTDTQKFTWVELFPKRGKGKYQLKENLFLVKFKYDNKKREFTTPTKIPYKEDDFYKLIGKK